MVIKSKKWKTIVSFGAFFLSVSLLLCHGIPLCYRIWNNGRAEDLLEQDYQKTEQFQSYMERQLSHFTALATGGTTGWYDGNVGWYGGSVDYEAAEAVDMAAAGLGSGSTSISVVEDDSWETSSTAVSEEAAGASTAAGNASTSSEAEKKQREQQIQEFLKYIKQDKNLHYCVFYDGEELYSNMEDVDWNGPESALRSGYNFYMCFKDGKVTIRKDGKEIDIYGDGVYREGEDWYVPGYKNFTVDEKSKKAKVVFYVAREPISYSIVRYGESSYVQMESGLYYLAQDVEEQRQQTIYDIAGLVFGMIFFGVYLILRREKKAADRFLGRMTGKVWFEGKALLLGVAAVLLCLYTVQYYRYYGSGIFTEIVYESSYGQEISSYLIGQGIKEILGYAAAKPGMLTAIFWILYLCVNDIRQNRKSFLEGGISRFVRKARTRELRMKFSRRMIKHFLLIAGMSLILIVLEFAIMFSVAYDGYFMELIWNYGVTAVLVLIVICVAFLGVCYCYLSRIKRQAEELDLLADQIQAIHDGDYSGAGGLPENSELRLLSENLAEIQQGMECAIEERMKSERMKVELVANVSHDIKTPLTSIISYVQFLKQEEDLPEHVKDYIHILDEKSQRLNNMVQDVFAVSKAASGQLPVNVERLDFGKLLRQTLADMEEQIKNSPVTMKAEIPEREILIEADGGRMYRVFQNLIQNALKYSLEGSRVFLTLKEDASVAVASIKNTSSQELSGDRDFTERFIRGDESRTDGGSGLGLSIAKSFTEACGGQFSVETIADLFVVTVSFPKVMADTN